jgi:Glyoxalase-like domain
MASVLREIVVDCRDAEAQAAWWSRVLDWPAVCEESGYWWISPDGTEDAPLSLSFIPVPEGKTVKNRMHLDLNPSGCEQAEELERLLALGARRKDIGQGPDVSWVVLEDPEGNEFDLLHTRKD